jgi:hypothetical protein
MKRQRTEKDQMSKSLLKWIGKGPSKDQSRSRSTESSHSSVSQANAIADSMTESGAEAVIEYSMANNQNMDVRYV